MKNRRIVDGDDTLTFMEMLESAPDALVIANEAGEIVLINGLTEQLFGYRKNELLGQPLEMLMPARYRGIHSRHRVEYFDHARRRPMGDGLELYGLRKDGSEFPAEISLSPLQTKRGRCALSAIRDISTRKQLEAVLGRERARRTQASQLTRAARETSRLMSHLAQHDMLTHLPNRLLLNDRIERAIAGARRHGRRFAVLFLDVDRFKHINDSLGHQVGDKLLLSVAERLVQCVRKSDTISRLGGDEFVVLLTEVKHAEDAAVSAQKIIASLAEPHHIDEHELPVKVSIGISVYPDDGDSAETLIGRADMAMYHAKEHGDGSDFFKPPMHARAVERQSLEARLRGALERQEFVLHYQPIVNLETGTILGGEALIRWRSPGRGIVPPQQFVPVAEDCGLIVPIGRWVLREACQQAQAWQAASLRPISVSVNISAVQFQDPDFVETVRAVLNETRLEARHLQLELTETVCMNHTDSAAAVFAALTAMGVRLVVDDFGTGYSSLSELRRLPLDALKVHQSFVHEITGDPDSAPIVNAMISVGKGLKRRVIAEGIETQEQLGFLQAQQCGEGQGFYFSRPILADQFAALL
jgi:diguanylate cyclase